MVSSGNVLMMGVMGMALCGHCVMAAPDFSDFLGKTHMVGVPKSVVELCDKYIDEMGEVETGAIVGAVQNIIKQIENFIPRDLDFFELFAGCGRLTRVLKGKGLKGMAFDSDTRDPTEDVNLFPGMLWATICAYRLIKGGLLAAAPECRTFIRASVYHMMRNSMDMGDEGRHDVFWANVMVQHTGFILFQCSLRGVFCLVEQPLNSYLIKQQSIIQWMRCFNGQRWLTYMGAFGQPIPKATWLMTTLPDAAKKELVRAKPKQKLATADIRQQVHKKTGKWWQGGPKLKETGAYTEQYCQAVYKAYVVAATGMRVPDEAIAPDV